MAVAALDTNFSDWFDSLKLKVIGPTALLADKTVRLCASSLQTGVHFAFKPDVPADTLGMVKGGIKSALDSLQQSKCDNVLKNATKCEYQIYENSARLLRIDKDYKRIKSEAELRYVVGDPIMEMICDSGNLKVHLEESVRSSNEEPLSSTETVPPPTTPPTKRTRTGTVSQTTPSTKVAEATSAGSRADYTCYTIRDSGDRILAVVIETKMDQSQNVLAQVMGYVAAFRKGDLFPPAAIVITEIRVDVLFFPFVKDSNRLLTAAHLSLSLWEKEASRVQRKCLLLVACLSYEELKQYRIEFPMIKEYEQMRKVVAVVLTQIQDQVEDAERRNAIEVAKRRAAEKRIAVLQEQIKELLRSRQQ